MAETNADAGNQGQQIQLRIDESKMVTSYANTIRTSTTQDEVVMDYGLNMPVPGPDNQPMLLFSVGSRVIMNWQGAKRLAISLGQIIRQYEEQNGEIQIQQAPQRRAGGGTGQAPKLTQ